MKDNCWICNDEFETNHIKKSSKKIEDHICQNCQNEKDAKMIEEDMIYWKKSQQFK